ncbi:MAG: hypothetical protein WD648_08745 [Planctomycetaceae bacterium]
MRCRSSRLADVVNLVHNRVWLQAELEEQMNLKEDQVVIVDLGEDQEQARSAATIIGQSLPAMETGTVVV